MDRETKMMFGTIIVVMIVMTSIILLSFSIINVPAGYTGVAVKGFGIGKTYESGWNFKNPFTRVEKVKWATTTLEFSGYDQVTVDKGSVNLITSDSVSIFMDSRISYQLEKDKVAQIRIQYPNYKDIIEQAIRRIPRDIASKYTALEIVGEQRAKFATEVEEAIKGNLSEYGIVVMYYTVQGIRLPEIMQKAIEEKKAAEQNVIKAEYERQSLIIQATAKRNATIIEAEGNAKAIETVMAEFGHSTSNYLYWQYISALNNPDSNIQYVLVPTQGGVPIILNTTS